SGGLYGTVSVSGNFFGANVANFITLGNDSGPSTASLRPYYSTYGSTTMAPFAANIDATGNSFDVGTGMKLATAMSNDELFDVEDRVAHATDAIGLGFVRVKAQN